ncbi:MAG: hypothetical protein R8L53_06450 [Mariprofundales bacterium]
MKSYHLTSHHIFSLLVIGFCIFISFFATPALSAQALKAIDIQKATLENVIWENGLQIVCDNNIYNTASQLHSTIALQIVWHVAVSNNNNTYDLRWRVRANDGSYQTEQLKKKALRPNSAKTMQSSQSSMKISFSGNYKIKILASSHCIDADFQSLNAGAYMLDLWVNDANDSSDNVIWHKQFPILLDGHND